MTMTLGERSKLYVAGHKGYGAGGFPAWKYPPNHSLESSGIYYVVLWGCNYKYVVASFPGLLHFFCSSGCIHYYRTNGGNIWQW